MSQTTASAPEATQDQERVLAHLNPADLLTQDNVREHVRLDKAFVASITERGVLTPITAYRREGDGAPVVLYGHRRTAAAQQAGLSSIPVYLVASQQVADRMIDQMAENDHRASLTTGERVQVFAALAEMGMSRAAIAKATATRRAEVKAALTTAASPLALAATQTYEHLTLDQAAVLADFEDDEEAMTALAAAARAGRFEHAAQVARDKRTARQQRAEVTEAIAAAGVRLIETAEVNGRRCRSLSQLLDAQGAQITPETHQGCPGHAAYVRSDFDWTDADEDQDDAQEPDELDEDPEPAEPAEPAPGEGDAPKRQWGRTYAIGYVCTDFAGYGHTDCYANKPAQRKVAQMSPTERAAYTAEKQAKKDNNAAWASATTVRLAWLVGFAARKTPPGDGARFTAATLAAGEGLLTRAAERSHKLAHELLGAERIPGRYEEQVLVGQRTTPARATHIALVLALAAHEEAITKDSWQSVHPSTAAYLTFLAAAKYPLADIERIAAGLPIEPAATHDEQEAPAA